VSEDALAIGVEGRSDESVGEVVEVDVGGHPEPSFRDPGGVADDRRRSSALESQALELKCTAPDHDYYDAVRGRLTANRATLSTARKLVRRARHVLSELGDAALGPVDPAALPPLLPATAQAAVAQAA
jgi:hypothetical protein